jgi:DNA polymerase III subunit delta'
MPFREIAGHQRLLPLIARAAAHGTLPPSMLFAGRRGVGKSRTATAVAEALNCLQPATSHLFAIDGCGACASCRRIARRVHADIFVVQPGESGTIKVDQVREMIDRTAFRPFEGRKRVVIVDDADAMVPAAQNALLKTLEEPPSGSIFILVSAVADSLLATVRSRCSLLRFGTLTATEIAKLLVDSHGYTPADARAAAGEGSGSVAQALEMRSVDVMEARSVANRLLDQVARAEDPARRIATAEILKGKSATSAEERNQLAACLRALSSLFRDVCIIASQADTQLLANADLEGELRRQAAAFDDRRSRRAFAAVDEALAALGRNASPKTVADWLVLQL